MNPTQEDGARAGIDALLVGARQGDQAAMGSLFAGLRDYLLAIARDGLNPALCAKVGPSDVVQDTFVQAQRAIREFAGTTEAELRGWMAQIALNRCRDLHDAHLRSVKRDIRRELPFDGLDSAIGPAAGIAVDTKTPSQHAVGGEDASRVMAALQILPDDMRQAIWLRNWESLPFEEIGRRLGRSSDAARKLFSRALQRLGQELEQCDGVELRSQ